MQITYFSRMFKFSRINSERLLKASASKGSHNCFLMTSGLALRTFVFSQWALASCTHGLSSRKSTTVGLDSRLCAIAGVNSFLNLINWSWSRRGGLAQSGTSELVKLGELFKKSWLSIPPSRSPQSIRPLCFPPSYNHLNFLLPLVTCL